MQHSCFAGANNKKAKQSSFTLLRRLRFLRKKKKRFKQSRRRLSSLLCEAEQLVLPKASVSGILPAFVLAKHECVYQQKQETNAADAPSLLRFLRRKAASSATLGQKPLSEKGSNAKQDLSKRSRAAINPLVSRIASSLFFLLLSSVHACCFTEGKEECSCCVAAAAAAGVEKLQSRFAKPERSRVSKHYCVLSSPRKARSRRVFKFSFLIIK